MTKFDIKYKVENLFLYYVFLIFPDKQNWNEIKIMSKQILKWFLYPTTDTSFSWLRNKSKWKYPLSFVSKTSR